MPPRKALRLLVVFLIPLAMGLAVSDLGMPGYPIGFVIFIFLAIFALTMMWILKYMREEPVQSATGERMAPAEVARILRRVFGRGNQGNRGFHFLPLAHHAKLSRSAEAFGHEAVLEALRILHRFLVHAHHHIARAQARFGRRALGVDLGDQRTGRGFETKRFGKVGRKLLQ